MTWFAVGVALVVLGLILCFVSLFAITGRRGSTRSGVSRVDNAGVGVSLIIVGLIIMFVAGITITAVAVPDRWSGVRVAREMSYVSPVSFSQAERVLPSVLSHVQIPGGWYFHEHGASSDGAYWRFSLGGAVVAKVCVSYDVMTTKWSARSGSCPRSLLYAPAA